MNTFPYGEWPSPLSADALASCSLRLQAVTVAGGAVTWVEGRPAEAGRQVLVRDGHDLLPAPWSARTRINEYGGRPYVIADDASRAWFSEDRDQRVYEIVLEGAAPRPLSSQGEDRDQLVYEIVLEGAAPRPLSSQGEDRDQRVYEIVRDGAAPRPLTPEGEDRYGDLVPDARRNRLLAVRERMPTPGQAEGTGAHESTHAVVAIALDGSGVSVLHEGEDFYGSIALAPAGAGIAFISWAHPNMPWDNTTLWRAGIDEHGQLRGATRISERAVGGESLSHFQPRFSPDGALYVVADPNGWWNLQRVTDAGLVAVCAMAAEFGLPQWVGGMSTWAFLDAERVVCARCEDGEWKLAVVALRSGELRDLASAHTQFGSIDAGDGRIAFLGGSGSAGSGVIVRDAATGAERELRAGAPALLAGEDVAAPELFEFEVPLAGGGSAASRGFYYAPAGAGLQGPAGTCPPVIVLGHGGPTGAAGATLNLAIQYWTTRGFAILDVNYRGSTGFGRAYREALYGQWGIADVADCAAGAAALASAGRADPQRLLIRGGSAGGFTTLAALAFTGTFSAGASHYGVSDLALLARDTHKFESRYLDQLVGPYPGRADLYEARSPIHHAASIDAPVLFLQGLEDKVVPPNQAETMVEALDARGVPVAYVAFEGEQHGFRKAENVRRALETELAFYGRVLGFTPAGELPNVPIRNLD